MRSRHSSALSQFGSLSSVLTVRHSIASTYFSFVIVPSQFSAGQVSAQPCHSSVLSQLSSVQSCHSWVLSEFSFATAHCRHRLATVQFRFVSIPLESCHSLVSSQFSFSTISSQFSPVKARVRHGFVTVRPRHSSFSVQFLYSLVLSQLRLIIVQFSLVTCQSCHSL